METLLACLTPPGKAAIATLGVRGPLAWAMTRPLFSPHIGTLPDAPSVGSCWFGRLGIETRDEVILAVKDALPCPTIELHCHGGVEVVRMIQELYEQQGARVVSWQQFPAASPGTTGQRDPRLLDLLVRAPTARTAAILLDQWCGAWDGLRHRDVPGEADVGPDPRPLSAKERAEIQKLRALIPLGRHLVEPWKVVLAGAPNVGKSSLMNALAGYTRSIVAPSPGTTRDLVTVQLAIDGWPIEMTDTAGLREATSDLERQGIQRTHDVLHEADLRLWLLDGAIHPVVPDNPAGWCFVINKTDLPAGWDWARMPDAVRVSAHTHAGLPELCERISRQLVPNPPAPGEAVPCLPEQVEQVEGA